MVFRKIGLETPSTEASDFELGSVIADIHDSSPDRNDELILEILFAIRRNLSLELEYQKAGHEDVEDRLVDPYFIIPRQNSLYLVGYCHLRQNFRTFKISRMKKAVCSSQSFKRNQEFLIEEFMANAWGIDQSGMVQDVTLTFSQAVAGYAMEELQDRALLEQVSRGDGTYTVRLKVRVNPEFLRFILQYGQHVEVLSPPEIRRQLRAEAENLLRMYSSEA